MQRYYGTKEILARPMTLCDYNDYRGWDMPDNEDPETPGYLVEYVNGGGKNHPDHDGYISWSPKDVFEAAYQFADCMSFGHALVALKSSRRVARAGWNGKGMWLVMVGPSEVPELRPQSPYAQAGLSSVSINAHIDMMTATGEMQPGWLASQTDMLAEDWQILD